MQIMNVEYRHNLNKIINMYRFIYKVNIEKRNSY